MTQTFFNISKLILSINVWIFLTFQNFLWTIFVKIFFQTFQNFLKKIFFQPLKTLFFCENILSKVYPNFLGGNILSTFQHCFGGMFFPQNLLKLFFSVWQRGCDFPLTAAREESRPAREERADRLVRRADRLVRRADRLLLFISTRCNVCFVFGSLAEREALDPP